jgi:hypothetical protein
MCTGIREVTQALSGSFEHDPTDRADCRNACDPAGVTDIHVIIVA